MTILDDAAATLDEIKGQLETFESAVYGALGFLVRAVELNPLASEADKNLARTRANEVRGAWPSDYGNNIYELTEQARILRDGRAIGRSVNALHDLDLSEQNRKLSWFRESFEPAWRSPNADSYFLLRMGFPGAWSELEDSVTRFTTILEDLETDIEHFGTEMQRVGTNFLLWDVGPLVLGAIPTIAVPSVPGVLKLMLDIGRFLVGPYADLFRILGSLRNQVEMRWTVAAGNLARHAETIRGISWPKAPGYAADGWG